jgi:hypothetical protein
MQAVGAKSGAVFPAGSIVTFALQSCDHLPVERIRINGFREHGRKLIFDLKELTPRVFGRRFDRCNETVNRFHNVRDRLVEVRSYFRLFLVAQICISLKNGNGNSSQMRHSGEELQKDQCSRPTKDRARVPSFPEETTHPPSNAADVEPRYC